MVTLHLVLVLVLNFVIVWMMWIENKNNAAMSDRKGWIHMPQLGESIAFKMLVWLTTRQRQLLIITSACVVLSKPHWTSKSSNYSLKIISLYWESPNNVSYKTNWISLLQIDFCQKEREGLPANSLVEHGRGLLEASHGTIFTFGYSAKSRGLFSSAMIPYHFSEW